MTPPTPTVFAPELAPPGVVYHHVEFERPKLTAAPRIILIHTNAASREGSLLSAWNWAHAAPNQNTCPTYQVDRGGQAAKMLASDEDAIANCTVADFEDGHGDVSEWSLAIETADTGTIDDPTISAFTEEQIETIATIVAYEAVLWDIPIVTPTEWFGSGVAGHTDPFGYPLWTCFKGKICPGDKKKAQVRDRILPRAVEIKTAWTTPPPPPGDDDLTPEQMDELVTRVAVAVWDQVIGKDSAKSLLVWSATKAGQAVVIGRQTAAVSHVEHIEILDAVITEPSITP